MDLSKVKDFITEGADDIGLYLDKCKIYHDRDPKFIKVVSYVDGQEVSFKIINDHKGDVDMSELNSLIKQKLKEMKHVKDKHQTRKY